MGLDVGGGWCDFTAGLQVGDRVVVERFLERVVITATAPCFAGLTDPVVVVDVTFHGLVAFRTGESVTRHGVSLEELLPSLERGTMVLPVVWVATAVGVCCGVS